MSILTTLSRAWLTRSFAPFQFTGAFDSTLPYRQAEQLGLYVHIPFCRSLCAFCPYCKVIYDEALAAEYVEGVLAEIDLVCHGGGQKKTATSLYFGGGTPALLAGALGRIIEKLREYFIITEGIGVELHPRDVTPETLSQLRAAGVTKLSIGVQSFQPDSLAQLGREGPDAETLRRALETVPFETVSMDFIFALPGQDFASVRRDIELAFSHGANHIALYPLIDFTFTENALPPMARAEKKQLLYDIVADCQRKGYVRDSIWTFSKEGGARYSSMTRENFLGFGCSATTLLKDQFKINTFDPAAYLARIRAHTLPTALTLRFTTRQRMVYYLFWTAYTMQVDPSAFASFFHEELGRCYGFEFLLARLLGFVKKQDGIYTLTTRGSYYYHYYEHYYTLSYIDQMWSLMGKTAFPSALIIK